MASTPPLDNLAPLAKAGVPLLQVCGSLDPQLADNTRVLEKRYKELAGRSQSSSRKAKDTSQPRPGTQNPFGFHLAKGELNGPVATGPSGHGLGNACAGYNPVAAVKLAWALAARGHSPAQVGEQPVAVVGQKAHFNRQIRRARVRRLVGGFAAEQVASLGHPEHGGGELAIIEFAVGDAAPFMPCGLVGVFGLLGLRRARGTCSRRRCSDSA